MKRASLSAGALVAAMSMSPAQPRAADVSEFYGGKLLTIIVSAGSNGAYTQTARILSKYLTKYLPGHPPFIVKNMPGAGHVLATNYMYVQAPRDGTFIATIGSAIPLHQTLDGRGVRFDARNFNWLGSTGISNQMGLVWHTAGIETIDDAKNRDVITGATGAGAGTAIFPTVLNSVIGTRFKLVIGYARNSDIDLALERGEVQSHHSYSYSSLMQSHPDWIQEQKVKFLYQVGLDAKTGAPGIPLMTDLAENEEQRQIFNLMTIPSVLGRLYLAPPEIPDDRLNALRAAFSDSIDDPAFVAESAKLGLDLFPLTWREVSGLVDSLVNSNPEVVAKAKAAMELTNAVQCSSVLSDAA